MSIVLKTINTLSRFGAVYKKQTLTYAPENNLAVDVFKNTSPHAKNICIYFLYGGRWTEGHRENFHFVAHRLLKQGYHVAIADYRKFPQVKFPDFIHDAAKGFMAVLNYFEADTDMIVMGHSAGAQIGAVLCFDSQYLMSAGGDTDCISKFIGISGPYKFIDYIDRYDDLPQIFGPKETYPDSQPVFLAQQAGYLPSMLLIHGEVDQDVLPFNTHTLAEIVNNKPSSYAQTLILPSVKHTGTIGAFCHPSWSGTSRMIMNAVNRFVDLPQKDL